MADRELRRLAADVDEQHHESMRTMEDDLGELHFGGGEALVDSRRRFAKRMATGGAIAFGATLIPAAAMMPASLAATDDTPPPGSGPPKAASEPKAASKDLQIAIFAQTVELAAVELYAAAVATGKLSVGVVDVGKMFAGHHKDHAGQFAAFAGNKALNKPNKILLDELVPQLQAAATEVDILKLARAVEEGAAATYVYALGVLESAEAAAAVSTILPIEAQHSIALSFAIDGSDARFIENATTNLPNFETVASQLDPAKYAAS